MNAYSVLSKGHWQKKIQGKCLGAIDHMASSYLPQAAHI